MLTFRRGEGQSGLGSLLSRAKDLVKELPQLELKGEVWRGYRAQGEKGSQLKFSVEAIP